MFSDLTTFQPKGTEFFCFSWCKRFMFLSIWPVSVPTDRVMGA